MYLLTNRLEDVIGNKIVDSVFLKTRLVYQLLSLVTTYPFFSKASTCSTVMPNMKMFSGPISSLISTLAPSNVPIVRAPLSCKRNKV